MTPISARERGDRLEHYAKRIQRRGLRGPHETAAACQRCCCPPGPSFYGHGRRRRPFSVLLSAFSKLCFRGRKSAPQLSFSGNRWRAAERLGEKSRVKGGEIPSKGERFGVASTDCPANRPPASQAAFPKVFRSPGASKREKNRAQWGRTTEQTPRLAPMGEKNRATVL